MTEEAEFNYADIAELTASAIKQSTERARLQAHVMADLTEQSAKALLTDLELAMNDIRKTVLRMVSNTHRDANRFIAEIEQRSTALESQVSGFVNLCSDATSMIEQRIQSLPPIGTVHTDVEPLTQALAKPFEVFFAELRDISDARVAPIAAR